MEQDDGTRSRVTDLAPQRGQRAFYQRVFLTGWGWRPYSLSVTTVDEPKCGAKADDLVVRGEPGRQQTTRSGRKGGRTQRAG